MNNDKRPQRYLPTRYYLPLCFFLIFFGLQHMATVYLAGNRLPLSYFLLFGLIAGLVAFTTDWLLGNQSAVVKVLALVAIAYILVLIYFSTHPRAPHPSSRLDPSTFFANISISMLNTLSPHIPHHPSNFPQHAYHPHIPHLFIHPPTTT